MNKKVNVIVYLPGYAGRFLMGIMSLDRKSMMPIAGTTHDTRINAWTFRDLHQRHGTWYEHHRHLQYDFVGTVQRFLHNRATECLTVAMHPREFYRDLYRFNLVKHHAEINYFHVDLDPQHRWVIEKFYQQNPWPTDSGQTWHHQQDYDCDAKFIAEFDHHSIDLAKIMCSEAGFLSEYHAITLRAGMLPHDTLAVSEYQHWRQARGLNDLAPAELASLAGEVGIEPTTG